MSILEGAALDSFHRWISQQVTSNNDDSGMKLTSSDIYKELRLRGYDYGKTFQGILESNNAGMNALLNGNYLMAKLRCSYTKA